MEKETKRYKGTPFAKGLMKLLAENNITQDALANALGVPRQIISYYVNGDRRPDIDGLTAIAKFFNVSADYLLGLSEAPTADINDREISNRLGLTSGTVKYLCDEVKALLKHTNKTTISEALVAQQKVVEFLTRSHPQEEYVAFIKELDLPIDVSSQKAIQESLVVLGLTPSFKTINTLVEDRRLLPAEIPGEYSCLSILEALEAIFRQETYSPSKKYMIAQVDIETNEHTVWRDEKGGVLHDSDCVYNLRILDLQNAIKSHRIKMAMREDYLKTHKGTDDE